MLRRKRKILAKIEPAYGQDAAPAAATDGVLLRELDVTPLELTYDERTLIREYLGAFEQAVGEKMVKIVATLEMAGFDALGTPIAGYDALMRACGLASVMTAGSDVAYSPVSDGFESATVYYEQDGVVEKALGCRGTLTLDMAVGKIPSFKLTLTGVYGGIADDDLGAPDVSKYQKPKPVNAINTTALDLLGYAGAKLNSLSLDLGNTVEMTTYVGDAETVSITDRQASGKVMIQATKVADKNWLDEVLNVATGTFGITHGPAGNQVVLAAPKMQLATPTEGEDKGIAFLNFDCRFLPNAGNDELTITVQ